MLLYNDFYSVLSREELTRKCNAVLSFNAGHEIFKGHFPSVPVVPGVCMMQIVKEMLEMQIGCDTRLTQASTMKFLTPINPLINSIVQLEINFTDDLLVNANLFNEGVIYFKFKGSFARN